MYVIATLLVVMLAMLAFAPAAFAQYDPGGVDKEGEWHVGEGLEHGDYFHYTLCTLDYPGCRNFEFEFWIKGDVAVGSETQLLAEVLVRDGDRVVTGNMTLENLNLKPTGSSQELNNYRHAFGSSVTGLYPFATADAPKAFSDASWGKIGIIGGDDIRPAAIEDVTVPAGTWEDAVMLGWPMGGVYSRVWVADGFPLPIKAKTFTTLSPFPPPIEYEFELQNYGNFQESPFVGIVSTSERERAACEARSGGIVPVMVTTNGSKYQIRASYGPVHPEERCRIELSVEFLGRDGLLLEQVQFDVVALDDDGAITRSIAGELGDRFFYAYSGTYHLEFDVMEPSGIAEYAIVVYGTAPDWVVPDQSERDVLAIPVEVRPKSGTAIPEPDENALANEAGHAHAPLAQARDGVPADKVACSDGRVLIKSPSGMPVCAFAESVDVLERRGFVLLSEVPCGDHSAKQPEASEKTEGIGSPGASKTSDRPFVTTWQTDMPNESITIPVGNATGVYTVDWGDGNISAHVTGDQSHTYCDAGTHTVSITGNFERIYLNGDWTITDKLQSIEQWGDTSWTSMHAAFYGARYMVYNAVDVPDLSDVTDMSRMFFQARSFNGDLSGWNVSGVTDMSWMFFSTDAFTSDLSAWDVSGVTDMRAMFAGAFSFTSDLSAWDVSGVTDMYGMLSGPRYFTSDLSAWDVSGVTDMGSMFYGASSFNGDISAWDVSGVTDMHLMFSETGSFNGDISAWDVSGVTDMHQMFHGAPFNGDISAWDVSGVTDMRSMFQDADSFNGDLSAWDVSGVTDMRSMFQDADSFNGDLSAWDVSGVTDMRSMFQYADSFNGDLSAWDVSGVNHMGDMLYLARSFNQNLGNWYIVLDNTSADYDNCATKTGILRKGDLGPASKGIDAGSGTVKIGNITVQNSFLDWHKSAYRIGSGADSALFEINGDVLTTKPSVDYSGKTEYAVNITSSGGFSYGTNNFRMINLTATGDCIVGMP